MRFLVNVLFTVFNRSRLYKLKDYQRLPIIARMSTNSSMSDSLILDTFHTTLDRYNGVTVHSTNQTCTLQEFAPRLEKSLQQWREEGRRGIWFKVYLEQSDWIPILAKTGFKYHHAKDDFVMMYLWLPTTESCNIPPYAHTTVGVGAIVVSDNSEILVVSEKYFHHTPHWKLPGGFVEPGENLVDAAIREVLEETGVKTEFQSVISFRQTHYGMFDCSDIYFVVSLKPLTAEIEKCEREIDKCQWMNVDEYLKNPNVFETNRLFVQKYLEYKEKNIKIDWYHGMYPFIKKPFTVYYVTDEPLKKDKN